MDPASFHAGPLDGTAAMERPYPRSPFHRPRTGATALRRARPYVNTTEDIVPANYAANYGQHPEPQRPVTTSNAHGVASGHTDAEAKVWTALHNAPGSSATELAATTSIGLSTVRKILVAWGKSGTATRTPGTANPGARRTPDRWTLSPSAPRTDHAPAPTDEPPHEEEPRTSTTPSTGEAAPDATADAAAVVGARQDCTCQRKKGPRLRKGELRSQVKDYLNNHRGKEFSPHAVGTALNRSAGAVHNALEKLVADGDAIRTQTTPKRFTAASDDTRERGD